MNYYPYFNGMPYMTSIPGARTGIFKSLFGNINFSSILNGTQKTLGIVNQAIPLIKQAGPVINNAKTMFKIMNEFKKNEPSLDTEASSSTSIIERDIKDKVVQTPSYQTNGPVFFQ